MQGDVRKEKKKDCYGQTEAICLLQHISPGTPQVYQAFVAQHVHLQKHKEEAALGFVYEKRKMGTFFSTSSILQFLISEGR